MELLEDTIRLLESDEIRARCSRCDFVVFAEKQSRGIRRGNRRVFSVTHESTAASFLLLLIQFLALLKRQEQVVEIEKVIDDEHDRAVERVEHRLEVKSSHAHLFR